MTDGQKARRAGTPYKENRRVQLQKAAITVMCAYGYHGLTAENISRQTSVLPGEIEDLFVSLGRLADVSVEYLAVELLGKLAHIEEKYRAPVGDGVGAALTIFQTNHNECRLLYHILANPATEHLIQRHTDEMRRLLRQTLLNQYSLPKQQADDITYTVESLLFYNALTGGGWQCNRIWKQL